MISGLLVMKMREVDALIKTAHEKRKEINVLIQETKDRAVHYDDYMQYKHSMNAIKALLYEINNRFKEINDILDKEKSMLSKLYVKYWLWIERKWLNPILRLVR